jgi:hypothetical protein
MVALESFRKLLFRVWENPEEQALELVSAYRVSGVLRSKA